MNQHEKFHVHIQIQTIQLKVKKLELCHLPFNDMQSYDIETKNTTEHSLMKLIFIPITH
jgi:hypothetical protein